MHWLKQRSHRPLSLRDNAYDYSECYNCHALGEEHPDQLPVR